MILSGDRAAFSASLGFVASTGRRERARRSMHSAVSAGRSGV
jgi:hypothetical protein